jgi:integrase
VLQSKNTGMKASANIYLDSRKKKNGKHSIKIKITFNRDRKYFATDIDLTKEEFEKVLSNQRRTPEQKSIKKKLDYFLNKAENIIENMPVFTFAKFEDFYLSDRTLLNTISQAYNERIEDLKLDSKISTALNYQCAKTSIENFAETKYKKKYLQFAEITPKLLKQYENFMIESGKSKTTVSMYLRTLRTLFNRLEIDRSIYPFGKNKYEIPSSRNIKKALTIKEINQIYHYEAEPNSTEEMAKDYWLFLYLCNGMNVKDLCSLKWVDIDGNILTYVRAKTQTTSKEENKIQVSLKSQALDIIKKWGQPSISKDAYIFPHLEKGMTAEKQRMTIQQLTKTINKYIKRIALNLGINRDITTYYARHSFATILKQSGANISMISDLLGHSSVNVTKNYLDSFAMEQIHEQTDVLTTGFNTKQA